MAKISTEMYDLCYIMVGTWVTLMHEIKVLIKAMSTRTYSSGLLRNPVEI